MKRLRELRRRVADERGFTLIELVVALSILGGVLAALSAVFISALHTQVDQTKRFEAQQSARVALVKLREEIHCAKTATIDAGGTAVVLEPAYSAITATKYCKAQTTSWCALPATTGFTLFHQVGGACSAASVPIAQFLTTDQVFQLLQPAGSRAKVGVNLRVKVDPAAHQREYRLIDEIVLRGSARA